MKVDNDDIVESIYDTALDPARLGSLVAQWASRAGSSMAEAGLPASAIERHLSNAFDLSNRLFESAEPELAQPTITFTLTGQASTFNTAAASAYGLSVGQTIGALPFDAASKARLQQCMDQAKTDSAAANLVSARRSDVERTVLVAVARSATEISLKTTDFVWPANLPTVLKTAFSLTKSEVSVVKLLTQGASSSEAAAVRHTSVDTVRTQLRSIYRKTSVHSVAELTRLVLGLASFSLADIASVESANNSAKTRPFPRSGDRRMLTLPDGRLLEYSVFGAPDGKPLLFLHDERCGDAWTAEAVATATAMGLQIVAPLRPCYGQTDDLPKKVPERRMQVAQDMVFLLDYLGLDKVVVVARVMGAGTAMCVSSLAPTRAAGIIALAPALPVADEDMARIHPLARIMIHSLSHNPSLAKFMMQAWMRLTQRSGIKESLTLLFKDAPVDLAIVNNETYFHAIEQGAKAIRGQGYKGFFGDVFDKESPVERCAALIQCPTHILVGEHDANSRKQRADRLAERSNHVTVSQVPGAGELFFYTEYQRLLDLAVGLFQEA